MQFPGTFQEYVHYHVKCADTKRRLNDELHGFYQEINFGLAGLVLDVQRAVQVDLSIVEGAHRVTTVWRTGHRRPVHHDVCPRWTVPETFATVAWWFIVFCGRGRIGVGGNCPQVRNLSWRLQAIVLAEVKDSHKSYHVDSKQERLPSTDGRTRQTQKKTSSAVGELSLEQRTNYGSSGTAGEGDQRHAKRG